MTFALNTWKRKAFGDKFSGKSTNGKSSFALGESVGG